MRQLVSTRMLSPGEAMIFIICNMAMVVHLFVINIGWIYKTRFGIGKGSKLVLFRFCGKDGSVSSSQVTNVAKLS